MMETLDPRLMNPALPPSLVEQSKWELRLVNEAVSTTYGGIVLGSVALGSDFADRTQAELAPVW